MIKLISTLSAHFGIPQINKNYNCLGREDCNGPNDSPVRDVGECSGQRTTDSGGPQAIPKRAATIEGSQAIPDLQINLDDVDKEDTIIGRGSFSVVYPGFYKNERVAVKVINTGSHIITPQEAFKGLLIMA